MVLYHAVKSYDMGQQLYFPSEDGEQRIFITLKNS
jgi:hypothetical protein